MIPVDAPLIAPPSCLLVERVEMPLQRGRIYLPPGLRMSTRSCEAVVVSVGDGLEHRFAVGDAVYLSTASGRDIKMGSRDERTLYRITPGLVLARIVGDPGAGIENQGESGQKIEEWEVEALAAIDEGDAEALR